MTKLFTNHGPIQVPLDEVLENTLSDPNDPLNILLAHEDNDEPLSFELEPITRSDTMNTTIDNTDTRIIELQKQIESLTRTLKPMKLNQTVVPQMTEEQAAKHAEARNAWFKAVQQDAKSLTIAMPSIDPISESWVHYGTLKNLPFWVFVTRQKYEQANAQLQEALAGRQEANDWVGFSSSGEIEDPVTRKEKEVESLQRQFRDYHVVLEATRARVIELRSDRLRIGLSFPEKIEAVIDYDVSELAYRKHCEKNTADWEAKRRAQIQAGIQTSNYMLYI